MVDDILARRVERGWKELRKTRWRGTCVSAALKRGLVVARVGMGMVVEVEEK